jgi:hypothetical protein
MSVFWSRTFTRPIFIKIREVYFMHQFTSAVGKKKPKNKHNIIKSQLSWITWISLKSILSFQWFHGLFWGQRNQCLLRNHRKLSQNEPIMPIYVDLIICKVLKKKWKKYRIIAPTTNRFNFFFWNNEKNCLTELKSNLFVHCLIPY